MTSEPIKFLIVDDTDENLVALEALLRRDGLEVLKARSGSEALELLLVHEVALAFLDVQMPEMDGFELAELMRGAARTKHVPIIFVTAGARSSQRVFKGYESGAVDFLFKPLEPHVLKGKADVFFELYRQRRELANVLRLNEMFVGILGHDLRNPLGAIILGAQLLERQIEDDKHQATLRRITKAGQRMTDMIEQLLDLTRVRLAGGLGFVRALKPIDVGVLVQRTVDELRGAHPDREIKVDTTGDGNTRGDADRLLQLFSNMIANALHHGTPGTAVSVHVQGGEDAISVCVHNQGVIPQGIVPTIFDPFRGRQPSSKSRGLGLGLFISQQIAAAHGGGIAVTSTEEHGTSFTVRLPRAVPGSRPLGRSGKPRRVLIVDDDQHIRDSLREAFEEEAYEVSTASNGQEALDLVRQAEPRPEVVILDLVLPVVDGFRVYQALQADPELARIPVIVSTSNPGRAPAGVVVIPKPLKLERLLDAVARALARDAPP
ncbi:MAG TPA: response regulator [Polyangiaceae bacterium]|nr:response regulator [Polyangiaceae bacterium]